MHTLPTQLHHTVFSVLTMYKGSWLKRGVLWSGSMVRGFYVYNDVWNPMVDKLLPCEQEFNPYAILVVQNILMVIYQKIV